MPHSDSLSDMLQDSLAEQIGQLLGCLYDDRDPPPGLAELRETFDLWMLELDMLTYGAAQKLRLDALTRRLDRYHHQITISGNAVAFARSTVTTRQPARARLEELFVSPLAQKIDRAIDWIDEEATGEPLVRLLVVPAFYLHAMWLVYPDRESSVLVVDAAGLPPTAFPAFLNGLRAEQLHGDDAFLRALAGTAPAIGVHLGGRARPRRP